MSTNTRLLYVSDVSDDFDVAGEKIETQVTEGRCNAVLIGGQTTPGRQRRGDDASDPEYHGLGRVLYSRKSLIGNQRQSSPLGWSHGNVVCPDNKGESFHLKSSIYPASDAEGLKTFLRKLKSITNAVQVQIILCLGGEDLVSVQDLVSDICPKVSVVLANKKVPLGENGPHLVCHGSARLDLSVCPSCPILPQSESDAHFGSKISSLLATDKVVKSASTDLLYSFEPPRGYALVPHATPSVATAEAIRLHCPQYLFGATRRWQTTGQGKIPNRYGHTPYTCPTGGLILDFDGDNNITKQTHLDRSGNAFEPTWGEKLWGWKR